MYAERTILTKKNNEILNSVSSVFNNTLSWKLFFWAHIHQAYYYHNFNQLAEFFMGNFQIENQDRIILMLVYPDPEEVCILEWDSPRLKLCYLRLWLFLFLSIRRKLWKKSLENLSLLWSLSLKAFVKITSFIWKFFKASKNF